MSLGAICANTSCRRPATSGFWCDRHGFSAAERNFDRLIDRGIPDAAELLKTAHARGWVKPSRAYA